jgi:hypothetical protein
MSSGAFPRDAGHGRAPRESDSGCCLIGLPCYNVWIAARGPGNWRSRDSLNLTDITSEMLRQAIGIYLERAYESPGQIPDSVRGRAASAVSSGLSGPALLALEVFERVPSEAPVEQANRLNLRLGNVGYLHMKLGLDRVTGTDDFVLVVDTHDRHFAALVQGTEQDQYKALVDRNAGVKEAIETAWHEAGLPTFQGYLREKLKSMKERGGSCPEGQQ